MTTREAIEKYAGKRPAKEIAAMAGITEYSARRFASRNGYSLRMTNKGRRKAA